MARGAKNSNTKSSRDWPQMRFGKRDMTERAENLVKIGEYSHPIKNTNMVVIRLTENIVPYFTAGIFEKEKKVASVYEVFGKLDTGAFCCISVEDPLLLSHLKKETFFKADKFKCLSFDRVAGSAKVTTDKDRLKSKTLPETVKRQRSTKYRTKQENEKVVQYAQTQVVQNIREFRNNKAHFTKKTVEKRGDSIMPKRITFTDE